MDERLVERNRLEEAEEVRKQSTIGHAKLAIGALLALALIATT
jgi:hypothetical protein